MTRILVVYATTDGHTAKVAAAIADTLCAHNATVDVRQVGQAPRVPDGYDGVVVAAPVRGGKDLKFIRWVRAHATVLNAIRRFAEQFGLLADRHMAASALARVSV